LTLIVGILCTDGVVMAADSAATYATAIGPTIGQQHVTKVIRLSDGVLYSSTGAIGVAQLVCSRLEKLWTERVFSSVTPAQAMEKLSGEIRQVVFPLLQAAATSVSLVGQQANLTAVCQSLVALPIKKVPCLYQFDHAGAPEQATKDLPFVALGSGQQIADPFLALLKRVLWSDREPTVAEGRFVAAWTITHVAQTNPGGVGGQLQLASLTMDAKGSPQITFDDSAEHLEAVVDAEANLRDHIRATRVPKDLSAVPKP
jgi:20S proteasome alpha/beta subunit